MLILNDFCSSWGVLSDIVFRSVRCDEARPAP